MRKIALLLCCVVSVLWCIPDASFAARVEPVYDARIQVPPSVKAEDIPKAIKSVLIERGWTVQREDGQVIESKIFVRSHTADIRIPFDKEFIHIQYVASTNLLYSVEQGTKHIHRNYNKWIRLLERDIMASLIRLQ
ncbi:MAG: hypothetical protein AB7N91_14295 [Candidatus Tectimicrobiota bacterium]